MTEMAPPIPNVPQMPGSRHADGSNIYGLGGCDHFALPTHNIALLERFIREILGGVAFYYAGFEELDRQMGRPPHIFIRVDTALMQCTQEAGELNVGAGDQRIAPHSAFGTTPAGLDANKHRLLAAGIPVAGPFRHRDLDAVSIYFRSPEGHKLEIVTWDRYAGEAGMLGSPEVGLIDWSNLVHRWPDA